MTDARVGALVAALAEGVRDELGAIADDMAALCKRVEELGESAQAINGLGGDCAGWQNHLLTLIAEVRKVQREVPAKLMGRPVEPIVQTVNEELAAKVKERRSA